MWGPHLIFDDTFESTKGNICQHYWPYFKFGLKVVKKIQKSRLKNHMATTTSYGVSCCPVKNQ